VTKSRPVVRQGGKENQRLTARRWAEAPFREGSDSVRMKAPIVAGGTLIV
jgi:hypothetical protein